VEEFLLVAPIQNFDSEAESIRLSDRTCIRHIERNELQRFIETAPIPVAYHPPLKYELFGIKYAIQENIEADSFHLNMLNSKKVDSVLVAFRLLKTSDVDVPCVFVLGRNEDFVLGWSGDLLKTERSENPQFLKRKEIPSFIRLWKKHQNLAIDSYLNFPLSEFMRAFETNIIEEKIFHHCVAFDSIVFHKEKRSIEPAGKVIGIAMGMLLGNSQKERDEIKNTLEKAYVVRNAVVHGNLNTLKKQMPYTKQLFTETEDYLRSTLRKLVEE